MEYAIFNSTSRNHGHPGYPERSGQKVEIIRSLSNEECDENEVGKMYRIRFEDGIETDAFSDELR